MSPLFITFEGVDGAGKTSQAWRLWRHLNDTGRRADLIWEPGATGLGEHIRQLLLDYSGVFHIDQNAELFLFAAARAQLVNEKLRPMLEQGLIVVSDRYADSTIAYQGYGRGIDLKIVTDVVNAATSGLKPDLTFLLDLSPHEGLARKRHGIQLPLFRQEFPDRLEQEPLDFHQRVRQGYLEMAAQEPERWFVVDATESRDEIEAIVRQRVATLLSAKERR